MVAIIRMRMMVYAAKPEIQKMSGYDQYYSRYQQPGFIFHKKLFQYQENKPGRKYNHWQPAVMMFFMAVVEGISTYAKGQPDHACFK